MAHLSTPQSDTGHFTTLSVRPSNKPTPSVSRTILFPRNHYSQAPNLAAGFSALDLSCSSNRSSSPTSTTTTAVRANLVGHSITRTRFNLLVETWGRNSLLHRADATWIEHASGARECQFGQFDTRDVARRPGNEHTLAITFPRAFTSQPTVVVWLNRLDLRAGDEHNYRLSASATQITRTGFVAHLDTWGDGVLDGAAMAWIAFPAEKRRVASGVVRTADVRSWGDARPRTSGWVRFPGRLFPPARRKGKPTVLIALKMLDMAGNADLRIKAYATEITREGFRWHLDTWDDSTLYAAEASWIALGFA
ncbi:hypothetical protein EV356DRAFT_446734 [Viridothelium virens]|uniref:H-type lectin domain-containing protein n=1 Tax=Viridothelium virens TaxID=1048519 RepID=A0A6A6H8B2_VIRVR|nr:hypothetical protein EV356DRAFT_446734 [Viridothelium virens]